jgi:hypothetical protein
MPPEKRVGAGSVTMLPTLGGAGVRQSGPAVPLMAVSLLFLVGGIGGLLKGEDRASADAISVPKMRVRMPWRR